MITTEQSDRIRLTGGSESWARAAAALAAAAALVLVTGAARADLTRVTLTDAACTGRVEWQWTGGDAIDVWESGHWEYAVTVTADGRYRLSALHQGRCHEAEPRDQTFGQAAHQPPSGLDPLPASGSGLTALATLVTDHPTDAETHRDQHVFSADRPASGATRLVIESRHDTAVAAVPVAPGRAALVLAAGLAALGTMAFVRRRRGS